MGVGSEGLATVLGQRGAGAARAHRRQAPSTERTDAVVMALIAGAGYELLRQRCMQGDGTTLLELAALGEGHPIHVLYLPVLRLLHAALAPFGLTLFEVASHLSCIAAAVAVFVTHTALRTMRWSRRDAGLGTALFATTPAIVWQATIVEFHAFMLCVASAAFLITARLTRRPTLRGAVLLGFATGAAYSAHASALLLPLPLLVVAWIALADHGAHARRGAIVATVLAVHVGFVMLLPAVLGMFGYGAALPAEVVQYVERFAGDWRDFGLQARVVWREWLIAYAPLSVAVLAALRVPAMRVAVLLLCGALLPYLGGALLLLSQHDEHGAYLLPMAWPAAMIAVRAFPFRVGAGAVLFAALLGIVEVKLGDEPDRSVEFAAGVRELAEGAPPALLAARAFDVEACFVQMPEAPFLKIWNLCLGDPERTRALLPALDAWIDAQAAAGCRVFLSGRVSELVAADAPASRDLAEIVLPHLAQRHDLIAVRSRGFHGSEVKARR